MWDWADGQALEKQKCQRSEELVEQQKHDAELASTRRCLAAGMDHIHDMLDDSHSWIRHCSMNRPFMEVVSKTKVELLLLPIPGRVKFREILPP